jgi:hypothetical protein
MRTSIGQHFAIAAFGLLSAAVSYLTPEPYTAPAAGFVYFLIFVPQVVFGRLRTRARERFRTRRVATAAG